MVATYHQPWSYSLKATAAAVDGGVVAGYDAAVAAAVAVDFDVRSFH